MPFSRGPSRLLGLLLATLVCLFYGSTGRAVGPTLVAKRLRGFAAVQVEKRMASSQWKHENLKRERALDSRRLLENCTKHEFDTGKRELVHSLYKVENEIGNLRRVSLGSKLCRVGLQKSINRTQKVIGWLSNNDFWRAQKIIAKVIADVNACNSSLQSDGKKMGSTAMQELVDSLNESLGLILRSQICYDILIANNHPSPLNYPHVNLTEEAHPSSVPAPDSESIPRSPNSDFDYASWPSLSPSHHSDPYNGPVTEISNSSDSVPSTSPYWDDFNDTYYDFWNSTGPALPPNSWFNFNDSFDFDFFNYSNSALSPDAGDIFNDLFSNFLNNSSSDLFPNLFGDIFNDLVTNILNNSDSLLSPNSSSGKLLNDLFTNILNNSDSLLSPNSSSGKLLNDLVTNILNNSDSLLSPNSSSGKLLNDLFSNILNNSDSLLSPNSPSGKLLNDLFSNILNSSVAELFLNSSGTFFSDLVSNSLNNSGSDFSPTLFGDLFNDLVSNLLNNSLSPNSSYGNLFSDLVSNFLNNSGSALSPSFGNFFDDSFFDSLNSSTPSVFPSTNWNQDDDESESVFSPESESQGLSLAASESS